MASIIIFQPLRLLQNSNKFQFSKVSCLSLPYRPPSFSQFLSYGSAVKTGITVKSLKIKASGFSSNSLILKSISGCCSKNHALITLFSDATVTVSAVLGMTFSLLKPLFDTIRVMLQKLKSSYTDPSSEELAAIRNMQRNLICAAGPLFFAALKDRPGGYLNTPLTVVASGMAKWLDIYSGVLMVRVLLSWFPNIPWDRQPLSAIRDLCDPYLNLFRNIIPPIFDTLDVSPLLAFCRFRHSWFHSQQQQRTLLRKLENLVPYGLWLCFEESFVMQLFW